VLTPSLLMDGSWSEIILNLSRVMFGIWLGTIAAVGFAFVPLKWSGRAIYAAIALTVVLPPETFPGAIWINAIGVTAAVIVLTIDWLRQRALRKSGAAEVPATRIDCRHARA